MIQAESFLARYQPFASLAPDELARVARSVQVEFFPADAKILRQGGEPARFLYVVRTGAVELIDEGQVLDLLGEGEVFGHPSLLSGLGPTFDVRAHEDTICYLVDPDVAEEVIGAPSGLAFLTSSLLRRERRAVLAREVSSVHSGHVPVRASLTRPPVTCDPNLTAREVATLMTRERVSSALVPTDSGTGIVTDRDLRSRVLAEGRPFDVPVGRIMSFPVVTASDDTSVDEVLQLMLEHGFHHMPITDGEGAIVGVVSHTELLASERAAPFAIRREIERAATDAAVIDAVSRVPEIVIDLVETDVDPIDVGHVIATTTDSATRQLIDLSVRELGDPPCPWAWLALGSEARHEQSLRTDQDHALVFDTDEASVEEADRYFAGLADRVTHGLEAAGIPRCDGGVMAIDPSWRRSMRAWIAEFGARLSDPGIGGKVFTNIALDYRRVAGPLDVEPVLDRLVREASRTPGFARRLARVALELRPPTGFFRDFVVEARGSRAGTLDVKHGGIAPITNLARAYALGAGLTGNRTLWRLRESAATGSLDPELASGLAEAFRLLWRVRLRHQASQIDARLAPDDSVDPGALDPLTRSGLKEAFRIIARAQRALGAEMGFRVV